MKKKHLIALIPIFLLLIVSCSSREVTGSFPVGNYFYRSYNFLGELVGEGSLYISQRDSNSFSGNWQIREVRKCPSCGEQFGTGFFTGHIESDTMYINLNPDVLDIDSELIGKITNGSFNGTWLWRNQAGFAFSGTFEATKL